MADRGTCLHSIPYPVCANASTAYISQFHLYRSDPPQRICHVVRLDFALNRPRPTPERGAAGVQLRTVRSADGGPSRQAFRSDSVTRRSDRSLELAQGHVGPGCGRAVGRRSRQAEASARARQAREDDQFVVDRPCFTVAQVLFLISQSPNFVGFAISLLLSFGHANIETPLGRCSLQRQIRSALPFTPASL